MTKLMIDEFSSNPFRELARMQREMERFTPSCDVEDTENHFLLSFDLPGMKKEDIQIELRDNQLTVSGERNDWQEHKDRNQYRSERFRGAFARSFTLPAGTSADRIETDYRDGVLRVAVPKAQAAKTQQIKVGETKPGFWDRLLGHKPEKVA